MKYATQKNKSGNSPPRPILFKNKLAILFGGPAANPSFLLGTSMRESVRSESLGESSSAATSASASESLAVRGSESRAELSIEHLSSSRKERTPSKKRNVEEEHTPKSKSAKKERESKLLEIQEKKLEMMTNALALFSQTSDAMVKASERMNDLLAKMLEKQ